MVIFCACLQISLSEHGVGIYVKKSLSVDVIRTQLIALCIDFLNLWMLLEHSS